jgi:hypothetical protein
VAAGFSHSVALRSDGVIVGWGDDTMGQCAAPGAPAGSIWVECDAAGNRTIARSGPKCTTPVVYCTGKPNSLGCIPSIALSNAPSMSSTTGATLTTSSLLPHAVGTYVHSIHGEVALPFHAGWLCIASPFVRHAPSSTGGTLGTCSGVLLEDLDAYIASGADPGLVAGGSVWLQAWSRDPNDPFGDSLSNAVSAVICP